MRCISYSTFCLYCKIPSSVFLLSCLSSKYWTSVETSVSFHHISAWWSKSITKSYDSIDKTKMVSIWCWRMTPPSLSLLHLLVPSATNEPARWMYDLYFICGSWPFSLEWNCSYESISIFIGVALHLQKQGRISSLIGESDTIKEFGVTTLHRRPKRHRKSYTREYHSMSAAKHTATTYKTKQNHRWQTKRGWWDILEGWRQVAWNADLFNI